MQAENRSRILKRFHMDVLDTRAPLKQTDQPINAWVVRIVYLWEYQRQLQSYSLGSFHIVTFCRC